MTGGSTGSVPHPKGALPGGSSRFVGSAPRQLAWAPFAGSRPGGTPTDIPPVSNKNRSTAFALRSAKAACHLVARQSRRKYLSSFLIYAAREVGPGSVFRCRARPTVAQVSRAHRGAPLYCDSAVLAPRSIGAVVDLAMAAWIPGRAFHNVRSDATHTHTRAYRLRRSSMEGIPLDSGIILMFALTTCRRSYVICTVSPDVWGLSTPPAFRGKHTVASPRSKGCYGNHPGLALRTVVSGAPRRVYGLLHDP